jgi:hypothetical protein
VDDGRSGKSFSTPRKVSKVKYINNLFESDGTTLFIYSIYSHTFVLSYI